MRNNLKRILAWILVIVLLVTTVAGSATVVAAGKIDVGRSDVYNKLYEAMQVNVIANTMKKCVASIKSSSEISASDAQSGKIFNGFWGGGTTDISTALWVEDLTQGEVDNGSIYCYQDDGSNILIQFSKITGMSVDTIICNQGNHRLLSRATWTYDGYGSYYSATEGNCSSFNDSGATYIKASDAADQFKSLYEDWRKSKSENPYLPTYDELGNFNNTDGYFSYIADFSKMCSADVVSASGKQSGTDYYKIAKFTQSDNKLVVQNQYYHVNDNKTWSYALSNDNPVKSCTGLLERIAALQKVGNGVGKDNGYENILIGELNDACKTAITENEDKIKEALADDSDQLKALEDAKNSGTYYKQEGKRDDDEGQIYQCVVDVNVESYAVSDVENESSTTEATCLSSGAAGTLGWIVCPLLEMMGNVAEDFYEGQIKNQLQVEPELFTGSGEGTKDGWEKFRTFANVIFIIMFLVVIFSQLTGVGINNYGIKKILPKLIVAAILINLSYLLCVALVDVSNILGNSLQTMFDSLGVGLPVKSSVITDSAAERFGSTLVSVAIIGVLVTGVILNPAILATLFISALGIVVSLLFLFVLLSVRQAAIVVLVVLSPLAVVAYVLPNTKTLFDKWWKMFKALLLVYPIVGLMVGGGNYVSRLLLASGMGDQGVFEAATAMIAGIVPVFFIPTVLKSSLAAMGTLGTKLSGLGAKASGWATKKATNSSINKNIQEMGAMRAARIKGGLDKNGVPVSGKRRGLANILSGGNRMRRKNALTFQSMLAKEGSLDAADGSEFMLATQTANVAKELAATGEVNSINALKTGLYKALQNEDRARIRAYTDALTAKGEDGRNAVKEQYNKAVNNRIMSSASAKTFADNIMANHAADYKNNNRAMFETVKNINTSGGGNVQTTDSFLAQSVTDNTGRSMTGQAKLATKASSSTLANMDDEAFEEVFGDGVVPAGLDSDEATALGATVYAALNDQNANIKTERRQKLETLLQATGYAPAARDVNVAGGSVSVNGPVEVAGSVDANVTNDVLNVHETLYQDPQGNVYEVRRTPDGRHVDGGGFDVQIDPNGKNGLKRA